MRTGENALEAARAREIALWNDMADCIDLTVDSDDEARRKREAPAPAPAPRAPAPAPKRRKKDILDTSSDEEEEEAAAPVAAPVPAAAAPAPAPAASTPAEEPKEPPKCKTCGAPCELRTARSAKNDGRRYWKFDAVSFDLQPRIDGVEA